MTRLFFLPTSVLIFTPLFSLVPSIADLSLEEKIGQLIMMATVSSVDRNTLFMSRSPYNLDPEHAADMIKKYHIGGIIFLGAGSPDEQYAQTYYLQSCAQLPLLIGLDAEWGLSMRHRKDVMRFPRAMTLGALSPDDEWLIYTMGKMIGQQCAQLGVHINFAPVVDVNSNPANPVINTRSFGADPDNVARKAVLYMRGMQDTGILTCAKHFPGHGDTSFDTHHTYGVVPHTKEHLERIELSPFVHMIQHNVDAIMTAHLSVPALSHEEVVPATLSYDILTQLLRSALGFKGLVITDGLGMRALAQQYAPAQVAVRAIKAGVDILLCPIDVPETVHAIKDAVLSGEISYEMLDERVQRILAAKQKVVQRVHMPAYFPRCLVTPEAQTLKQQLYQAAVTCVKNEHSLLPVDKSKKIILYSFGDDVHVATALRRYVDVEHHALPLSALTGFAATRPTDENTQVIVSIHVPSRSGMIEMRSAQQENTLGQVPDSTNMMENSILLLFGSLYSLKYFKHMPTILLGYENEPEAQEAVVQVLIGNQKARGVLPITLE